MHACREKYIEAQLAKRLGIQPKKEGEDDDAEGGAEDDLYTIPDNLKAIFPPAPAVHSPALDVGSRRCT
jgi:hypothetical protein